MSTEVLIPKRTTTECYEAVLRSSEAASACRTPEDLVRILAEQLGEFLPFDHLDVLVFKENCNTIECHAWGKGAVRLPWDKLTGLVSDFEELPISQLCNSQEPLRIADWNSDERYPGLKQWVATMGVAIGSVLRVPLTTPHRRLGTLGIASAPGITYSAEDVSFLRLIGRVVAFAIDDGLNLRRAQAAQAELQRHNDRLQLLLNLTNRITSNLELRDLLRAISANILEVMQLDGASISLFEPVLGKFRVYALDFPHGRGFINEELLLTPIAAGKRALDTLKPIIVTTANRDAFPLSCTTSRLLRA